MLTRFLNEVISLAAATWLCSSPQADVSPSAPCHRFPITVGNRVYHQLMDPMLGKRANRKLPLAGEVSRLNTSEITRGQ